MPTSTHNLLRNHTLVIKFYDSLYFNYDQNNANLFICIDCNYLCKTVAYTTFSKLQKTLIPKHYRSHFFEIPIDITRKQFVRLVIIQDFYTII